MVNYFSCQPTELIECVVFLHNQYHDRSVLGNDQVMAKLQKG